MADTYYSREKTESEIRRIKVNSLRKLEKKFEELEILLNGIKTEDFLSAKFEKTISRFESAFSSALRLGLEVSNYKESYDKLMDKVKEKFELIFREKVEEIRKTRADSNVDNNKDYEDQKYRKIRSYERPAFKYTKFHDEKTFTRIENGGRYKF